MSLFYGKRQCNRPANGKRCGAKLKNGHCPCIIDLRLHDHPIVLNGSLCALAIQASLKNHCYLLIHQRGKKIFFYYSKAMIKEIEKTFPGYRVYPAIGRKKEKCLP